MRLLWRRCATTGLVVIAAAALLVSACGGSDDAGAAPPATRDSGVATADTPTDDSRTYAEQALGLLAELATASESVAAVMADADVDSPSWREVATSRLDSLRELHSRAVVLEANAVAEPVHEHLVTATEGYERAARLLEGAIRSQDIDKASEAAAALGEAVYALADVRLLLEDLQRG